MSKFKIHKLVNSLPNELTPDTLYLIRNGLGFDIFSTDITGSISYTLNTYNSSNTQTITGTKNLTVSDPTYQFLSSSSSQVVNLPLCTNAPYKEFYIVNTGTAILELKENNNTLDIFLKPKGNIKCYSDNNYWHIFINY